MYKKQYNLLEDIEKGPVFILGKEVYWLREDYYSDHSLWKWNPDGHWYHYREATEIEVVFAHRMKIAAAAAQKYHDKMRELIFGKPKLNGANPAKMTDRQPLKFDY